MEPGGESAVKAIAALRRGLDVLFAIERSSAMTLTELYRETSLPKATLLRILKTLQQSGRVVRDTADRYMLAPAAGEGGPVVAWRARFSALAAPARATLQRRVAWPVDLAVRDGTAMLILDIDRPINGLAVNYRALGFRPPMLMSSLGRCYLAFCPDQERKQIIAALARSPRETDRAARHPDSILRMAAHARQQGYVLRDPSATSIDSPDRFGAISVPVHCDGRVVACISCSWLLAVATTQDILRNCFPHIEGAARNIEDKLLRAGFKPYADIVDRGP